MDWDPGPVTDYKPYRPKYKFTNRPLSSQTLLYHIFLKTSDSTPNLTANAKHSVSVKSLGDHLFAVKNGLRVYLVLAFALGHKTEYGQVTRTVRVVPCLAH